MQLWSGVSQVNATKIKFYDSKNERFDLYILQKKKNDHAIPLFVDADVLPVKFLYFESVCCLMYDVRNKTAPSNILNLFTATSKTRTYNTRSSTSNKFYIKRTSKLVIQENRSKGMEWAASFIKRTNQKAIQKETSHCSNGNFAILRWLRWYYSNKHSSTEATILNNSIVISLSHMWLLHCSWVFFMVKLLLLRS